MFERPRLTSSHFLSSIPLVNKISRTQNLSIKKSSKMSFDQDDNSGIFPDQIISKILTRLPAKSICRFKSVSKRWNSMICNPNFISTYISSSSSSWSIFDRFIRVIQDAKDSVPEFKLQWQKPPNVSTLTVNPNKIGDDTKEFSLDGLAPSALLLNSSNGLLLISIKIKREPFWEMNSPNNVDVIDTDDSLFVVNPITNDWVSIPIAPVPIIRQGSLGFVTRVGDTGVLERFMIVDYQPFIATDYGSLMCFRSETGKWKRIQANYMLGEHIWKGQVAHVVDGHLLLVDPRVGIITWDDPFARKKMVCLRFIGLPRQCRDWVNYRGIDVSEGYIQYLEVCYDGGHKLNLWRLRDYQAGEWNLVHQLSFNDLWSDSSYLALRLKKVMPMPHLMHPFEAHIAFFAVGTCIFSLDVRSGKVKSCCSSFSSMTKALDTFMILAKVTLPSWPTSFPPILKATLLKEQGNCHFMAEIFNKALDYYSKSIALSPNALAYANRAMTHLKVGRYREAEVDCTEALKLDGKYLKAYMRRAAARKELGDLKGYVEDAECVLKLKPDDEEIKKLYAEVKKLKLSLPRDNCSTSSR